MDYSKYTNDVGKFVKFTTDFYLRTEIESAKLIPDTQQFAVNPVARPDTIKELLAYLRQTIVDVDPEKASTAQRFNIIKEKHRLLIHYDAYIGENDRQITNGNGMAFDPEWRDKVILPLFLGYYNEKEYQTVPDIASPLILAHMADNAGVVSLFGERLQWCMDYAIETWQNIKDVDAAIDQAVFDQFTAMADGVSNFLPSFKSAAIGLLGIGLIGLTGFLIYRQVTK